jgi:hypothetical protein
MNAGFRRNGVGNSLLTGRAGYTVASTSTGHLDSLRGIVGPSPRVVEGTGLMIAVDVVTPQLVAVATWRFP